MVSCRLKWSVETTLHRFAGELRVPYITVTLQIFIHLESSTKFTEKEDTAVLYVFDQAVILETGWVLWGISKGLHTMLQCFLKVNKDPHNILQVITETTLCCLTVCFDGIIILHWLKLFLLVDLHRNTWFHLRLNTWCYIQISHNVTNCSDSCIILAVFVVVGNMSR